MAVIGTTAPTRTSDSRSPMRSISVGAMSDPSRIAQTISESRMPNTLAITRRGVARCSIVRASTSVSTEPTPDTIIKRRGDLWQIDESEQSHGNAGEKGRACDEGEWPP